MSTSGSAPRRGRPPRLSQERIVETAQRLIDERGLDAFTMRALAAELGSDPMAIYRHFANKAELLGAISDAVLADIGVPATGSDWRAEITRLATRARTRLAEHPGLAAVLLSAPLTPASLAGTAESVALLQSAGFTPEVSAAAVDALFSFVLGYALVEHAGSQDPAPQSTMPPLAALSGAATFDLGLEILLDGLAARRA
jgi:AcrR family transcriptional regulator